MCGRYSLALRLSQIRAYLEDENMPVDWAAADDGDHAPRYTYNFAPGNYGMVYRAEVPDWGAGPRQHKKGDSEITGETEAEDETTMENTTGTQAGPTKYKIDSMKWGLIPFWTKRSPEYSSMLKTINCRDDSLIENRGMWTTMKARKRCIVVAQGFYEWLKKPGSKDKVPHFVKRKDGKLMCMAGLWDCVKYENGEEKLYTYTIITTSSNKQLNFLHDRMPVILDNGSDDLWKWLDPGRYEWTKELQSLCKPYESELEVYPVAKEVGKVGNNSPTFIVPINSSENKNNIANFFNTKGSKPESVPEATKEAAVSEDEKPKADDLSEVKQENYVKRETIEHQGTEDNAPLPVQKGVKHKNIDDVATHEPPKKVVKVEKSPIKAKQPSSPPTKSKRAIRSSTSNGTSHPKPVKKDGNQKITGFFGK